MSGFGNKPAARTSSMKCSDKSGFDKSGTSYSMCNNSAHYVSINLETPRETYKDQLKIHIHLSASTQSAGWPEGTQWLLWSSIYTNAMQQDQL